MGSPYNVAGTASKLFQQNKGPIEYRALSTIAHSLAHPQRALLCAFVQHAIDRELASQFFLDEVAGEDKATASDFLADWVCLLETVRPVICTGLGEPFRRNIWKREGGRCCVSKTIDTNQSVGTLVIANILSPSIFLGNRMKNNERLSRMFVAFLGESNLRYIRSQIDQVPVSSNQDQSDQVVLLSADNFEHFRNGRLSFRESFTTVSDDSAEYMVHTREMIPSIRVGPSHHIILENRATELTLLPNAQLLNIHHRFAEALAWLDVLQYMEQNPNKLQGPRGEKSGIFATLIPRSKSCWSLWYPKAIFRVFGYVWVRTPAFFRAFAYTRLVRISERLYGHTGSDRTHRLPFNLYLRVGESKWAPKHQAEAEALRLVEKYTHVPAPRVVDAFQYSDSSFLLMTGVPGIMIGRRIHIMNDEQLDLVARDLKQCIAELRQIPNDTASGFQICNALGSGILDWRIGDSQRKELKFRDETQFNEYLVDDLPLDEDAQKLVLRSHSVNHDIVFTHADLNMRNILVDEDGRLSGIVDWECAGWYPEYWEYTKAHFGARYTFRWVADVVDRVFSGYRDELRAEDKLSSMAPSW